MIDLKGSLQVADYARLYVRKGLWCVPLWHCTPDGCGCGDPVCESPGLHPIGSVLENASKREEEVSSLFLSHPTPNIGVVTGSSSRIVGIAVDLACEDSDESWQRLTVDFELAPDTATTGGGHTRVALYRLPHDFPVLPHTLSVADYPGITVLAEGAFFVAPPSIDPYSGSPINWSRFGEFADIPRGVLEHFLQPYRDRLSGLIKRRKLSHQDSLTYLKGFYQHLISHGADPSKAWEATKLKGACFTEALQINEIDAALEEINKTQNIGGDNVFSRE